MNHDEAIKWCRDNRAVVRFMPDCVKVEVYTTVNHFETFTSNLLTNAVSKAKTYLESNG